MHASVVGSPTCLARHGWAYGARLRACDASYSVLGMNAAPPEGRVGWEKGIYTPRLIGKALYKQLMLHK